MGITSVFVGIILLLVIVYDIYIIVKKGKYHSVSAFLIRSSKKYPMVPFLLGFTCGHLFWSMDSGESQFKGAKLEQYKECVSQIKDDQ